MKKLKGKRDEPTVQDAKQAPRPTAGKAAARSAQPATQPGGKGSARGQETAGAAGHPAKTKRAHPAPDQSSARGRGTGAQGRKAAGSSLEDLERELAAIEAERQSPVQAPDQRPSRPGTAGSKPAPRPKVNTQALKRTLSFQQPDEQKSVPSRDHQAEAIADGRAAGLAQVVDAAGRVDPRHWPKVHAPAALARGTPVFYRGERYYVELAPKDWSNGCYVRIVSKPVNPDPTFPTPSQQCYRDEKGVGRGPDIHGFSVHADLLSLAPPAKSHLAKQPTLAAAVRAERKARGERDVGDEVAVALRDAKSIDDVYRIGAEFLGVGEAELRAKYGHLNPGQQRMNVGNRMRNWLKKGKK